ncbi:sphingosine hydroxylase ASCRUDRAFT_9575 [Ascoidea rubescens DSM 1968]|uniref:Fatty acid hydroxylase domain-containing protein n=1 Tax=Ascoidea rubescens DSM 1968 TaxID=1344418 RepID=A0A1D2VBU0_9ASCO|nr:hypothetical protein ASCRUDRAFT_9575 [Ascoidea rubescens DSM 1968]ODV59164.1 hypothetical protein ASCRUDRAFT_9575 [Ascoidea rubescens DSM 1968]
MIEARNKVVEAVKQRKENIEKYGKTKAYEIFRRRIARLKKPVAVVAATAVKKGTSRAERRKLNQIKARAGSKAVVEARKLGINPTNLKKKKIQMALKKYQIRLKRQRIARVAFEKEKAATNAIKVAKKAGTASGKAKMQTQRASLSSSLAMFELKDVYSNSTLLSSHLPPALSLSPKPDLIQGIPDGITALVAPVAAYWIMSIVFLIIDTYQLAEKYRIHPPEEVVSRNKASFNEVLFEVFCQHIIQTFFGYCLYLYDPKPMTGYEDFQMWRIKRSLPLLPSWLIYLVYNYLLSGFKILVAITIVDTWQFFWHRAMHLNKFLYKHFHSRHHRLYVPYAFGALYNAPVEGFLLDTLGTGIAAISTFLTPRECIFLYTFATMKTVDDHCGYVLPYDPFQIIFPNNALYHDIHHQHFGIKTNYSQPFFIFWDQFFKTTFEGLDDYKEKQRQITLNKYKQFLNDRKLKNKNRKSHYQKIKQIATKFYNSTSDEDDSDSKKNI